MIELIIIALAIFMFFGGAMAGIKLLIDVPDYINWLMYEKGWTRTMSHTSDNILIYTHKRIKEIDIKLIPHKKHPLQKEIESELKEIEFLERQNELLEEKKKLKARRERLFESVEEKKGLIEDKADDGTRSHPGTVDHYLPWPNINALRKDIFNNNVSEECDQCGGNTFDYEYVQDGFARACRKCGLKQGMHNPKSAEHLTKEHLDLSSYLKNPTPAMYEMFNGKFSKRCMECGNDAIYYKFDTKAYYYCHTCSHREKAPWVYAPGEVERILKGEKLNG